MTNKNDFAGSSPAMRAAAIRRIEARVKRLRDQVGAKEAELISISGWTVAFDYDGEVASINSTTMDRDRLDRVAEAAIQLVVLVEARNHAASMLHALEASQ